MMQGILSKSDLSNAISAYPFAANKTENMRSNRNVSQPKSVKDWAMQNGELTRTLTDGNMTSSLMKKAQENAASIQVLEGLDQTQL